MDAVTDLRKNPVPCTFRGCGAQQGDLNCYTATGFPRPWHAVRRSAAAGETPAAAPAAGSASGRRPTHKQADILLSAVHNDSGEYEVSGYRFHGDAQRRQAMDSMVGPARGWFERVRHTDHGTLYKITDAGRAASDRYEAWLGGSR